MEDKIVQHDSTSQIEAKSSTVPSTTSSVNKAAKIAAIKKKLESLGGHKNK